MSVSLPFPVARITYTVLVETSNHAQSINQSLPLGDVQVFHYYRGVT